MAYLQSRRSAEREAVLQARADLSAQQVATLNSEMRSLQDKLAASEKAWVQFNEEWKAASRTGEEPRPSQAAPVAEPVAVNDPKPHPFVARFQQAMRAQSQNEWTLEDCSSVSEGIVKDASLFRRGAQGAVSGMIRCARMELTLPPAPESAWLLCFEGHSIEEGRKIPLPENGYRLELAPVNLAELREALPELFASHGTSKDASAALPSLPVSSSDSLRDRLDALCAKDPSGYRLVKFLVARESALIDVQIEERAGETLLARFLAAQASPRFDAQSKSVELILERGSIERKGKISPIPATGLRLHFPKITPAAWKAAGGPTPPGR